jgi:hypothetical protein
MQLRRGEAARPHRRRALAFVISLGVLCLPLVAGAATNATNYRYQQGTAGWYEPDYWEWGQTSGFNPRNYNGAYRGGGCEGGSWKVRYYNTSGSITWQNETLCSPTEIGNSTGDRRSWCAETGKRNLYSYAYNCDTTIP